jgi:hypothetical protein
VLIPTITKIAGIRVLAAAVGLWFLQASARSSTMLRAMSIRVLALLCLALAAQAPKPNAENFAHWRDHIRPKASELAFEDCEWKPTFWEAVLEAQARQKPLLLWAMNGHPMACT